MATTQIKRLYQQGTEFVPITLSEAVVVNTDNLALVNNQGITTLDKVLRIALGILGNSANSINTLNNAVDTINDLLKNKQDTLTAGTGIEIKDGVISTTAPFTLYRIVESLPTASEDCINYIYLVPDNQNVSGNSFKEIICVQKNDQYVWEEIGTVQTSVDLSGYITRAEYSQKINEIETDVNTIEQDIANVKIGIITAQDITLSNNSSVKVAVNYSIPDNLYDSMVNMDENDQVIGE